MKSNFNPGFRQGQAKVDFRLILVYIYNCCPEGERILKAPCSAFLFSFSFLPFLFPYPAPLHLGFPLRKVLPIRQR